MPDESYTDITIGDTVTAEQIIRLPEGSTVTDRDGDSYILGDDKMWTRHAGNGTFRFPVDRAREYFDTRYRPYTLRSLPNGVVAVGIADPRLSDTYQEARLALRDVLGMEPDEQMIRNTMGAHRPQITTMHETAKRVTNVPKPAAPNLTAGFGIAVSGGGFAASATVDTDDTVNGLARLRAHSALDALLDQHGISR